MKKIIILSLAILSVVSLNAQTTKSVKTAQYATAEDTFDVNGVKLGDKLTLKQVKAIFGNPTKIESKYNLTDYYFGKTTLNFINDKLDYINIYDKGFRILTNIIPNGIGIGDKESDAKAKIQQYANDEIKTGKNSFIVGGEDVWIHFQTNKGIITEIHYGFGF